MQNNVDLLDAWTLGPSLCRDLVDPNKNFHILFSDRSVKET